ncbi:MAG: multiheme c-type cytochrome [Myxococcaceae bacterium]
MRPRGWQILAALVHGLLLLHPSMRPRTLWVFPILLVGSIAFGAEFIGPEACKGCHLEAYNAFKQSKHARALESLSDPQRKDARCISCHAPNMQEQTVAHVTCETCHGGGHHYATNYVMKDAELARLVGLVDPSEKGCRTCHDASSPSLRPFDFVEKLKLIDHWTAERARRQAQAGGKLAEPKK